MSADQLRGVLGCILSVFCKGKLEAAVCDTEQATDKRFSVQSCFGELIVAQGVKGEASFMSWQQHMRVARTYA